MLVSSRLEFVVWVTLPLASSGKLLKLSLSQFPYLYTGDNNSSCFFVLWWCLVYIQLLENREDTIIIIFCRGCPNSPSLLTNYKEEEKINGKALNIRVCCVCCMCVCISVSTKYRLYRIDSHHWDLQFRENVVRCIIAAHPASLHSPQSKIIQVPSTCGCTQVSKSTLI